MYADGGKAESGMLLCQLDGILGLYQVGASDHELDTSCIDGALDHVLEVVFVGILAVVDAMEDGVREIDANLQRIYWLSF